MEDLGKLRISLESGELSEILIFGTTPNIVKDANLILELEDLSAESWPLSSSSSLAEDLEGYRYLLFMGVACRSIFRFLISK